MSSQRHSDVSAFWGVFWRSFAFLPYMLLVFAGVGGVWFSRWVLPFCVAVLLYDQDWWQAVVVTAAWLLMMWAYRRFHLRRFFEEPPSLL